MNAEMEIDICDAVRGDLNIDTATHNTNSYTKPYVYIYENEQLVLVERFLNHYSTGSTCFGKLFNLIKTKSTFVLDKRLNKAALIANSLDTKLSELERIHSQPTITEYGVITTDRLLKEIPEQLGVHWNMIVKLRITLLNTAKSCSVDHYETLINEHSCNLTHFRVRYGRLLSYLDNTQEEQVPVVSNVVNFLDYKSNR